MRLGSTISDGPLGVISPDFPGVLSIKLDLIDVNNIILSTSGILVRSSEGFGGQGNVEIRNNDFFVESSVKVGTLCQKDNLVSIGKLKFSHSPVLFDNWVGVLEDTGSEDHIGLFEGDSLVQFSQDISIDRHAVSIVTEDSVILSVFVGGSVSSGVDDAFRGKIRIGEESVEDINTSLGRIVEGNNSFSVGTSGSDVTIRRDVSEDHNALILTRKVIDLVNSVGVGFTFIISVFVRDNLEGRTEVVVEVSVTEGAVGDVARELHGDGPDGRVALTIETGQIGEGKESECSKD